MIAFLICLVLILVLGVLEISCVIYLFDKLYNKGDVNEAVIYCISFILGILFGWLIMPIIIYREFKPVVMEILKGDKE